MHDIVDSTVDLAQCTCTQNLIENNYPLKALAAIKLLLLELRNMALQQ